MKVPIVSLRHLMKLSSRKSAVLPVPAEASGAMVTYTAREFPLAKATLTARYGR